MLYTSFERRKKNLIKFELRIALSQNFPRLLDCKGTSFSKIDKTPSRDKLFQFSLKNNYHYSGLSNEVCNIAVPQGDQTILAIKAQGLKKSVCFIR